MTKQENEVQNTELEQQEQEQAEKAAKISEMQILLAQRDYTARKVAFEVAAKLKELHPELSMPVYEKYRESEAQAQEFRNIIDELGG